MNELYLFNLEIKNQCEGISPSITYPTPLLPLTYTIGDPTLSVTIPNFVTNVVPAPCMPINTYEVRVDN